MKTIAIIEDDMHIGNIVEQSLKKEGYGVCRAYSGTEARYLLADGKRRKPDLILLDLMLPGMTGEQLLPEISDKNIPVIIISAKAGLDDKVDALLGGAADYITKPFEMKELLARIEVQFRNYENRRGAAFDAPAVDEIFAAGGLMLDPVMHEVGADSTPEMRVRLTRTEFAILRLLMQHTGHVISKSAILDNISRDTPDCTDSSLKQHISNLRKKLGDIGKGGCIESVWGIGFRLN